MGAIFAPFDSRNLKVGWDLTASEGLVSFRCRSGSAASKKGCFKSAAALRRFFGSCWSMQETNSAACGWKCAKSEYRMLLPTTAEFRGSCKTMSMYWTPREFLEYRKLGEVVLILHNNKLECLNLGSLEKQA